MDLNENVLNENHGTCGAGTTSIDWNGNGSLQSSVSYDINFLADPTHQALNEAVCGGALSVPQNHDDWAAIVLGQLSDADGSHREPVTIIDCDNPAPQVP